MSVFGPLLQEKALQFSKQIEGENIDFTASDRWLDQWKKRFVVQHLTIKGEALSRDKDGIPDKSKFFNLLNKEGISGEQLYNCDETIMNYRKLLNNTLPSKKEAAAPGYKKNKDHVTILATGTHCIATETHKL